MSSIASTSHPSDWRHLAKGCTAGGAAAVISKTALAPVDRLKLVLQLQHAQAYLAQQRYTGLMDCLVKIKSEQVYICKIRIRLKIIFRVFYHYGVVILQALHAAFLHMHSTLLFEIISVLSS